MPLRKLDLQFVRLVHCRVNIWARIVRASSPDFVQYLADSKSNATFGVCTVLSKPKRDALSKCPELHLQKCVI